MTHKARFIYDSTRTLREAELVLEDYYASGEISPAEQPLIQKREWIRDDGTIRTDYDITLPME